MIIGHGDIASVIPDRHDRLYFASGVSNSSETRESEYQRETDLLRRQKRDRHIVYFSSLCVFYSKNRYAAHKRNMEFIVADEFRLHTVVRLGNITWGTNPHTLINFMRARVEQGKSLNVQDVYRYVVDLPEFLHWLGMIPAWSCEMNIAGKRLKVIDIVRAYVRPGWQRTVPTDDAVMVDLEQKWAQAYGY